MCVGADIAGNPWALGPSPGLPKPPELGTGSPRGLRQGVAPRQGWTGACPQQLHRGPDHWPPGGHPAAVNCALHLFQPARGPRVSPWFSVSALEKRGKESPPAAPPSRNTLGGLPLALLRKGTHLDGSPRRVGVRSPLDNF